MMHMVHIPAIIIPIVIPFHIRIVHIFPLLVVPDHVLHIPDPDTKYDIDAVLELTLAEDLVLVEHFEVAAEGEETVAARLMLGADAAAADLVAKFSQTNVL